jgi:hypothetical protein
MKSKSVPPFDGISRGVTACNCKHSVGIKSYINTSSRPRAVCSASKGLDVVCLATKFVARRKSDSHVT